MGASLKEKEAGEIVVKQKTTCGRLERTKLFIRNNRTSAGFALCLILIHFAFICERTYSYRHSCTWVIIARASGQCLHFDCSLVLLLTLRKSVTWLRSAKFDVILPLDRHIYFHKLIGWAICVLSLIHTIAHIANFAHLGQLTGISLYEYLFNIQLRIGWIAGLANPSGFAILGLLIVIAIFSHRIVRKSGHFEVFYWTHLSCIPFYALLVIHAPNVWKWIVIPICIFVLEILFRMLRIYSGTGRTSVTSAALLPNQVVRLKIARPADFEFRSGDYVYVNIPCIAKHEWHPFTISSAPEDDYLTLHIRVAGGWTNRLHTIFSEHLRLEQVKSCVKLSESTCDLDCGFRSLPWQLQRDNFTFEKDFVSLQMPPTVTDTEENETPDNELRSLEIPLHLDGPYGGPSTSIWRCKRVLLIAGGIGITPFASLLQSLVHKYKTSMSACLNCGYSYCTTVPPSMKKLQRVDFLWVNRDLLSFQWFLELLLNLDKEQSVPGSVMEKFLNIQLYQTGTTTRSCEICSSRHSDNNLSVISNINQTLTRCKCQQLLHKLQHLVRQGRPIWDEVFDKIARKNEGSITVFYCGPPMLGSIIQNYCRKYGFAFKKEMF